MSFQVQVQVFYVHNNCSEAVIGKENLESQAPSNDAQTICKEKRE